MNKLPDCVLLEMRMAELMAQQQASGFRFDKDAAVRVKARLGQEADGIETTIKSLCYAVPGKRFTPKRTTKHNGYVAGAEMTRLEMFNPTSRAHIHWFLTTSHHEGRPPLIRASDWPKTTDSGKPKVDEAVLSELADSALEDDNAELSALLKDFINLFTLQKGMGQLSEGSNSWLNSIEDDGCIHHSCTLSTATGRNAHRGPNLGQVNSEHWARELFVPHHGDVLVGCDLEGLELRVLGHFLAPYDNGAFAEVVVNGDIHQQNADRVGCSRKQVKTLTYAFMYGAGDTKLGHSLQPELSDGAKKILGAQLRRKFLEAIPGLGPLVEAVKLKVKEKGKLKGLDGRPIHCRAEHSGLNFLCQSAGAILSKRWVVIGQELLDREGLIYGEHYKRCAYVHDEVQLSVKEGYEQLVSEILVEAAPKAGAYYGFRVPITASAQSGASWAETH